MRFARIVSAHSQSNLLADRLAANADLDVLQLDYRWEATIPSCPLFANGFAQQLRTLNKVLFLDPKLHLITNAGAGDVVGCAEMVGEFLCEHGDAEMLITAIRGDNLRAQIDDLLEGGVALRDSVTGEFVERLEQPLVSAHVELGGGPIATALHEGSRIVIAGCYDATAPLLATASAALGWQWDEYNKLAELAVAVQVPDTVLEPESGQGLTLHGYEQKCLDGKQLARELLANVETRRADVHCHVEGFELLSQPHQGYRIAGVSGQSAQGRWLLRLNVQSGYLAEGRFTCTDIEAGERAIAQLTQIFRMDDQSARVVELDLMRSCASDEATQLLVTCRSAVLEPCVELVEQLKATSMQLRLYGCKLTGVEPSWQAEVRQLQCYIPREAVAVSVDTRPAKEWR